MRVNRLNPVQKATYFKKASYKPNEERYLQIMSAKDLYIQNITVSEHAKDLYIQNITVSEHDNRSNSFQVKFPNVFMYYQLGALRVEDPTFIHWDHYKFTLWQIQLNFVVFCASSACGISAQHMDAKKPMIRSIYRFHVHYHIKRILKILEIPLPYENSFHPHNNPYNQEKLMKICDEYKVGNDLTNWRNQGSFQCGKVELGKQVNLVCHI